MRKYSLSSQLPVESRRIVYRIKGLHHSAREGFHARSALRAETKARTQALVAVNFHAPALCCVYGEGRGLLPEEKEEKSVNSLQKLIARLSRKRRRKPGREKRVKPFKRSRAGGWAELDRRNTIPYPIHSQGAK